MEITRGVGARVVFHPVGDPSFIPLTEAWREAASCSVGVLEAAALSQSITNFPFWLPCSLSFPLDLKIVFDI